MVGGGWPLLPEILGQPAPVGAKSVVDFLLELIEFFSLGVTAEALRANIGSKSAISLQRCLQNTPYFRTGQ